MSLLKSAKAEIIKKFAKTDNDTGSPEVQIALLTSNINNLTEHFKIHKQDKHSRRGLIRKVNLRRKLLSYLKKCDTERYRNILSELNLRG